MKRGRAAALAALMFLGWTTTASADETIGAWTVSDRVSPLTGVTSISAQTVSTQDLVDPAGQPERARLVMACYEGTLSFFAAWPEVLRIGTTSLLAKLPEATVRYRLDGGPIKDDAWVISNDGAAAGSFDNVGAPRLIAALSGGRQLVLRMTGRGPQDAVFPIDGVDAVAAKLRAACGVHAPAAPVAANPSPSG